jgi:hypothetical protein
MPSTSAMLTMMMKIKNRPILIPPCIERCLSGSLVGLSLPAVARRCRVSETSLEYTKPSSTAEDTKRPCGPGMLKKQKPRLGKAGFLKEAGDRAGAICFRTMSVKVEKKVQNNNAA